MKTETTYWTVPRMWEGKTVAILASGPSMSKEQAALVKVSGIPSIAINTTFRLAPWASMLYAADPEWWAHPSNKEAHEFAGLKVSCSKVKGVHHIRYSGIGGFDPNPAFIRTGSNSAYQALHIAIHAGAKKVILLGVDMSDKKGGHWHKEHPIPLRTTAPDLFARWIKAFEELAKCLKGHDVDIVNCSPSSALLAFRKSSLEKELGTCSQPTAA